MVRVNLKKIEKKWPNNKGIKFKYDEMSTNKEKEERKT
jgi:hypothetical protein